MAELGLPHYQEMSLPSGIQVDKKTIMTDSGERDILRVEKPFRNNNLQGIAIDDIGLIATNQNAVIDKDYIDIHEPNHIRYKETFKKYASLSRYFDADIVEELANRKISDEHFHIIRGKRINTAGMYTKKIREMLEKRHPSDIVEVAMRDLEYSSDLCYQKAREVPIDIHKEYANIKRKTCYIV